MDSKSKHPQDLRQITDRGLIPESTQNTPIEGTTLADNSGGNTVQQLPQIQ